MSSFALNDAVPLSVAQGFDTPPNPWAEAYWGPAIFMAAGGIPAVTGTATFAQAAASWAATLSERIAATATFDQSASWDATASERISGTATWDQTQGWAATANVVNPVSGTATWTQTQAWDASALERLDATATFTQEAVTWDATASERYTSTAEFVQAAATWDAAALERLSATAEWVQTQAWDATAQVANPISATASFDQAAAEWNATSTSGDVVTGTATWVQDATWDATATESIRGAASWSDGATDYDDSGVTYDQGSSYDGRSTTTWAAAGSGGIAAPLQPAGTVLLKPLDLRPPHVIGVASFAQQPASWHAEMTTDPSLVYERADEEALLALV